MTEKNWLGHKASTQIKQNKGKIPTPCQWWSTFVWVSNADCCYMLVIWSYTVSSICKLLTLAVLMPIVANICSVYVWVTNICYSNICRSYIWVTNPCSSYMQVTNVSYIIIQVITFAVAKYKLLTSAEAIWVATWDFSTMWYVGPANAQISLHICAVWSEPLLVAWIFYEC